MQKVKQGSVVVIRRISSPVSFEVGSNPRTKRQQLNAVKEARVKVTREMNWLSERRDGPMQM